MNFKPFVERRIKLFERDRYHFFLCSIKLFVKRGADYFRECVPHAFKKDLFFSFSQKLLGLVIYVGKAPVVINRKEAIGYALKYIENLLS